MRLPGNCSGTVCAWLDYSMRIERSQKFSQGCLTLRKFRDFRSIVRCSHTRSRSVQHVFFSFYLEQNDSSSDISSDKHLSRLPQWVDLFRPAEFPSFVFSQFLSVCVCVRKLWQKYYRCNATNLTRHLGTRRED